jgi:hypothetical protein
MLRLTIDHDNNCSYYFFSIDAVSNPAASPGSSGTRERRLMTRAMHVHSTVLELTKQLLYTLIVVQ